ncbi:unnamed protein product, partial [Discosporangium mesarthrocarpum]
MGLMCLQALTGINTVVLYSSSVFRMAGVGRELLATLAVGACLTLSTLASGALVDRAGRRPLLLGGTGVMAASLFLLSGVLFGMDAMPRSQGV